MYVMMMVMRCSGTIITCGTGMMVVVVDACMQHGCVGAYCIIMHDWYDASLR